MRLVAALVAGFVVSQIAILCTTIYLHRGMAHRALTLKAPVRLLMRIVLWLTTGMRPRVWAAVHRRHHAYTDTELDPHSPMQVGWLRVQMTNPSLYRAAAKDPMTMAKFAKDLPADRLDKALFDRAWLGLGIGITFLIVVFGPVYGLIAAVFHTICYLQLAGAVNAIGHHFGKRPYENSATNLQWLAMLTMGEGLHNNHHGAPTSATFRLHRGEFDPGWVVVSALKRLHLASVRLDRTVYGPSGRPRTPEPVGG
jgi:stearoyl-CoA desaturase (Delta-9 desaturase)